MTKKHYEYAAAHVRNCRASGHLVNAEIDAMVAGYIALFVTFNPRFDAARFEAACRR